MQGIQISTKYWLIIIRKKEREKERKVITSYTRVKKEGRAEAAAKKSPHFVIKPRNSSIDFGAQLIKISSGEFF